MRRLVSIVFVVAIAACGGGSKSEKKDTTGGTNGGTGDTGTGDGTGGTDGVNDEIVASCTAMFTRERDCTEDFIPALVDLRVKLDMPAGIAAEVEANGRDAIIEQALTEWSTDSSDENIAAQCSDPKLISEMTPEQMDQAKAMADDCLAQPDCGSYVACVIPFHEWLMTM